MQKLAAEVANSALSRLDKIASDIQANYEAWGMPFETAKAIVNDIDKTADEIEVTADGPLRIITLNRPEELNAVNDPLHVGLAKSWILQYSLPRDADASAGGTVARLDSRPVLYQ